MNSVRRITQPPALGVYPAGARTPVRAISDSEFVWMRQGRALLRREDDTQGPLEIGVSVGTLVLIPPGLRHEIVWDPSRESRHGYLHFEPGRPSSSVRTRWMTGDDPFAGICAYLLWLGRDRRKGWERRVLASVEFLLDAFETGPLPEIRARTGGDPMADVVAHLRAEWSSMPLRRVGVGELANIAHVSRSYLARLFRADVGMPAAGALEAVRLTRVEDLLLRTDMAIASIARQCGFADPFHLSHRFRGRYKMSPSAFRARGGSAPSFLEDPGVARLASRIWG